MRFDDQQATETMLQNQLKRLGVMEVLELCSWEDGWIGRFCFRMICDVQPVTLKRRGERKLISLAK